MGDDTKTHTLKTWCEPFQAVWDGIKTFEIRNDDRGFEVGDTLLLREWDHELNRQLYVEHDDAEERSYTGREVRVTVTYIARGWGWPHEMCVMSFTCSGRHDRGCPGSECGGQGSVAL